MKLFLRDHFFQGGIFFVLISFVVVTYRYVLYSFFQQDEWYSMGQAFSGGIFSGLKEFPAWYYLAGYIRFPGTFLNNLLHVVFPLNTFPFAILSLLFHGINTLCVYWLSLTATKDRNMSFIAGVFFAITAIPYQAVSWFAATTTALPSLTFSLLSIVLTLLGIQRKKTVLLFFAQVSIIVSFLFKESSIVLILLLPLLYLFVNKLSKRSLWNVFEIYSLSLLYVLYVVIVRFYILLSPQGKVGVFITTETNSSSALFQQLITYPFIGISQTFIPFQFFSKLVTFLQTKSFINMFLDVTSLSEYQLFLKIMDATSIFLSFIVIAVCIYFFRRSEKHRLLLLIGLYILVTNFIPIAVLKRLNTSYFESRYYYAASVGAALLFSAGFVAAIRALLKRLTFLRIAICFLIICCWAGYEYKQISITRAELLQQNIEGAERRKIIQTIKTYIPRISDKTIFFVDGDSLGYYGIPGQKIPFQQGIGFTLMTLYYSQGTIPHELLDTAFLWNLNQEGYKESGNKGFGFFSSYYSLQSEINNNPTNKRDVYSVYWHSSTKTLDNTTNEIDKKLNETN